jgi:undecaprenyl pyrophosphate phosphatase UppP
MTYGQGILYGAIQGLTEFLPVSSSAHLTLLPWLAGWEDPGLGFDVALHVGTLLAVLWYFWRDWWELAIGALDGLRRGRPIANEKASLFWKIAAASVPGAVLGLALEHKAGKPFALPRSSPARWHPLGRCSTGAIAVPTRPRASTPSNGAMRCGSDSRRRLRSFPGSLVPG